MEQNKTIMHIKFLEFIPIFGMQRPIYSLKPQGHRESKKWHIFFIHLKRTISC